MPEISETELEELQRLRAEKENADAAAAREAARAAGEPPEPTHRAVLADGSTFDYAGMHPTHVTREGDHGETRVLSVHSL